MVEAFFASARRKITERPEVVARKSRPDDREAGAIIGQNHRQAIVSFVERASKLTRLAKVERHTAELVA